LRLPQRGRIEAGYAGDVIVFDPERIRDTATFTEPLSYAVGIDHLLVNGDLVISGGEMTGALPGKVLRHRP
jgi:N-acyl-D-aspartate/D-glutamate deacylase